MVCACCVFTCPTARRLHTFSTKFEVDGIKFGTERMQRVVPSGLVKRSMHKPSPSYMAVSAESVACLWPSLPTPAVMRSTNKCLLHRFLWVWWFFPYTRLAVYSMRLSLFGSISNLAPFQTSAFTLLQYFFGSIHVALCFPSGIFNIQFTISSTLCFFFTASRLKIRRYRPNNKHVFVDLSETNL